MQILLLYGDGVGIVGAVVRAEGRSADPTIALPKSCIIVGHLSICLLVLHMCF